MTKCARSRGLLVFAAVLALALGNVPALAVEGAATDDAPVREVVMEDGVVQPEEDGVAIVEESVENQAVSAGDGAEGSDASSQEEGLEETGSSPTDATPPEGDALDAKGSEELEAAEGPEADAPTIEEADDASTEEEPETDVMVEVHIDSPYALLKQEGEGIYSLVPCDEAGSVLDGGFSSVADGTGGIENLFVDESVVVYEHALAISLVCDGVPLKTTLSMLAPTNVTFSGNRLPEFPNEPLVFENTPIAHDDGWIFVPSVLCAEFVEALPSWAHRIVALSDEGMELSAMASATPGWKRIWGQTAYDTMQKIVQADSVFQTNRGGNVIVATGDGYWDALAASALAGRLDAPIIITPSSSLCTQASEEIKRLRPERIYIMGGELAINKDVELQLKKLCPSVKRVWGETAPDTAVAIYKEKASEWGNTAIVTTCNGYWDALSIAPYAYAKRAPIFLTLRSDDSSGRILSSSALNAIKQGGFSRVIITGGNVAVSDRVETQLAGIGVGNVRRIWGQHAIDTSAEIAKWEIAEEGLTTDHLTVATSNGYWDALSAAAYVGHFGSVLVLVDNDGNYKAFDAVYDYNNPGRVGYGRVLGGEIAICADAWTRLTSPWALKSVNVSEEIVSAGTTITVSPKLVGNTGSIKYNYFWVRNGSWADGEWGSTLQQTGSYATSASGPMTFRRSGTYTIMVDAIDASNRTQRASHTVYVWKLDKLDITDQGGGTWVASANWGIDASKVKDVQYRFTWKRSSDGATGTISNWGSSAKATFGESTFGYAPGTYTITVETRKGSTSLGTASKSVQIDDMSMRARDYYSSTGYLIMVDCTNNKVGIYTGYQGNWSRIRYCTVSTGAPWTPTVKGVFTVGIKGYVFGDGYSCYYYTQFYGDYLFHTILYDPGTFNVQDGRLGMNISHGCVRMAYDDAKWIWDNIPYGTTVVVYD